MATGLDARTATIKAMDEVTGPIIAVALVLCAVFVPCAFISGITGQFFRQFAVTIAVSTVISAINAVTMTPSRAVLIFKTETAAGQGPRSHQPRGAALVDLRRAGRAAHRHGWARVPGRPLRPAGRWPARRRPTRPRGCTGPSRPAISCPALLVGGLFGWFVIRPVNAVLGWFFRGFNRGFDGMTAGYGWTVGKALRFSVVVLLVYGGLLVLT